LLTVSGLWDFSLTASYDSQLAHRLGPLGYGWTHNFEASARRYDGDLKLDVHWDANRVSRFERESTDEAFTSVEQDMRHVNVVADTSATEVILLDGTRYVFGGSHRLEAIRNAAGQSLNLSYDGAGRLTFITDAVTGVSIGLHYDPRSGLLSHIRDMEGRSVSPQYDSQMRLTYLGSPTALNKGVAVAANLPRTIPSAATGESLEVEMGLIEVEGTSGSVVVRDLVIAHERPEDLDIVIVNPAGRTVSLLRKSDFAEGKLTIGFLAFGSVFEGDLSRGTWKLRVKAKNGAPAGQLESFELNVFESSRMLRFVYEDGEFPEAGRLLACYDARNMPIFANLYDEEGRVVAQDDGLTETPLATVSYSDLGDRGLIETVYRSPMGFETRLTHDSRFLLKQAVNALGQTLTVEHDLMGNVVRRVDGRGNAVELEYDELGRVIVYRDELGAETRFAYHEGEENGRSVASITDALGNVARFEYNGGASISSARYNAIRVFRAEYHPDFQLKRIVKNEYSKVDFYTDARGRISKRGAPESTSSPASGEGAEKEYDLAGRVVLSRDFQGRETTIRYTGAGEVARSIDADGNETIYDYDHRGRLIVLTDARGKSTRYAYDGNGNLLSSTNPAGAVTRYEYDFDNRMTKVVDALDGVTLYEYDALGQVVAVEDAIGRVSRYEYDAQGNVTAVYDANGLLEMVMEYDARGYPVRLVDAAGNATRAEYDILGRKTRVIEANGYERRFEYSGTDWHQYTNDSLKRRSFAAFNGDRGGAPVAVEVLPYDYDDTDPPPFEELEGEGLFLKYKHDYSNNLTEQDDGQVTYKYNSDNQLERAYVGGVADTSYLYDGAGRIEFSKPNGLFGGFPDDERDRQYLYDPAANLTEVRTSPRGADIFSSATRRIYDDHGRLRSYIDAQGGIQNYTYDANDNLVELSYPGGQKVHYAYDAASRLTRVTDWAGRVTEIEWSDDDRVTRVELPNGVVRSMAYNRLGQPVSREDVNEAGETLLSYQYQYDENGKVVAEIAYPADAPPVSASVDADYDMDWNRLQRMGSEHLLRDFGGHIVEATSLGEVLYNRRGRMNGTQRYKYLYDAEDNLVGWQSRDNPARQASFVVNPADSLTQVIERVDTDGQSTSKTLYVYGLGLLYEEVDGTARYLHPDLRGSTVALSDQDGVVIGRVSYEPYGEIASRSGQTDTMFLFNGQYGCATSPEGLVYMRFRWYWPTIRQFMSRDAYVGEIDDFSTLNYFTYAGGDPISRVDPEGEFWHIVIGAVVGAAINTTATFIADIVDDGKINTDGNRYLATALGGAVNGMVIAGTGGLGGAIVGGALGSATENLVYAALTGQKVDPQSLAIDTAIGGVSGGVGYGASKATAKVGGRIYASHGNRFTSKAANGAVRLFRPDKATRRLGVYGTKQLLQRSATKTATQVARKSLVKAGTNLGSAGTRVLLEGYLLGLEPGGSGSSGGGGKGFGVTDVWIRHHRGGEPDKDKQLGVYRLYNLYLEALEEAGQPIIQSPNYNVYGF
jgi:RHS repeat-associated protein